MKKRKIIGSKIMPYINICDEGATLLAEGILSNAAKDYKYCWAIKQIKNGGDWIFVGKSRKKRKKGEVLIIAKGGSSGMKGTVDDNIHNIENYIEYHPLIGHMKDEIICNLREEAMLDKENITAVKELRGNGHRVVA